MQYIEIFKTILFLGLFFIFNKLCLNYKFFLNDTSISEHKSFISKNNKVLITGGFFIIFGNIIYQKEFFLSLNNLFYVFIFFIGLFADIYKKFLPFFRIFLQILIILFFIKLSNLMIKDVRIDFINSILSNEFISLIFTIFCIIVLINGSNFIDGVNLSTISYYLLVLLIIYILSKNNYFLIDPYFIKIQIFLLFSLLFFNFRNHVYLGDSGVYLVSFITSVTVINFINNNSIISPYFAVLLLWYPCFENLFSIIRRFLGRRSASEPDNKHLHHLIYSFLNKKKINYSNNITGIIILLFNIPIFYFGYKFYYKTQFLILTIFLAIFLYLFSYFILKKKIKV